MQVAAKWSLLPTFSIRSEEHTSELQSLRHLVCRLLLEKKKRGAGGLEHASVAGRNDRVRARGGRDHGVRHEGVCSNGSGEGQCEDWLHRHVADNGAGWYCCSLEHVVAAPGSRLSLARRTCRTPPLILHSPRRTLPTPRPSPRTTTRGPRTTRRWRSSIFQSSAATPDLHSFPTRRSSD